MSQPPNHKEDRVGGLAGRLAVGVGQVAEPIVGTKEVCVVLESSVEALDTAPTMAEKARLDNKHMAKMERQMNHICALLHDLMAVRQAEQYYAEAEATLTTMGSSRQFLSQKRPLFSMPNGGLHENF
ncbi:hypothetical protein LPJ73_000876 [Coemansia sp. RSA 2703]|nr:hypothetical protein LPJ73_000876 [Coemansia sp. RSA 2703]KAJ2396906.1 hypothetical protein GGI05_000912 [Coemansia sp. RSA 2603]